MESIGESKARWAMFRLSGKDDGDGERPWMACPSDEGRALLNVTAHRQISSPETLGLSHHHLPRPPSCPPDGAWPMLCQDWARCLWCGPLSMVERQGPERGLGRDA